MYWKVEDHRSSLRSPSFTDCICFRELYYMSLCLKNSSISWFDSTINTLLSLNRNPQGIDASVRTTFALKTKIELARLKKGAVRSYRTRRFSFSAIYFHSHLKCLMAGKLSTREVVYQLNHQKRKIRLIQGKQYLRDTCSMGKLKFKYFFRTLLLFKIG